jgi:catechol 2,3-dioxygenase-like lactoylglutathione lyase family enzyme
MKTLSPILWTKDLAETISFYESVLGFKGKSNFPNFVSLRRGNIEIMFVVPQNDAKESKDLSDREDLPPNPHLTGSIFITMDDVDELWDSVKQKETIKTAIDNREYLMRDFSILDNNGYELVFGKDIS